MFIHTYEEMIKIENLLEVWNIFLRGKRFRSDVMMFQTSLSDNLTELHNELVSRTYRHNAYAAFNVADPKPRNIHKACVRDRFLHHLLYRELVDYFEKIFIYDSYSCRKNKGTHRALKRFQLFAGQVSANHSKTCYVLKCDVKKFFASIDQQQLKTILNRHIADPDILRLLDRVIDSFYSTRPGVGLPLGNLTSQLLVNIYMNEFDRHVKQVLKVKYYLRYADDFIVLSQDRGYLNSLLIKIKEFLSTELKLILHENKVSITTYSSGVDFLGWVHFPYHRQLRTATKRRVIKRLGHWPQPTTVNSYRGLLSHGNTYKLQKQVSLV